MLRNLPIAFRLALVFLLATLLPMGLFGYYSFKNDVAQIKHHQQQSLQSDADGLALQIQAVFKQYQILTQAMAADTDIVAYTQNSMVANQNPVMTNQALHDLQKLHQSTPNAQQVSVLSTTGLIKLSSLKHMQMSMQPKEVTSPKMLASHIQPIVLAGPSIYFSAPIVSSTQQRLGVMVIKVDAQAMIQLIEHNARQLPDNSIQLLQSPNTVYYTTEAHNHTHVTEHGTTHPTTDFFNAHAPIANTNLKVSVSKPYALVMRPVQQLLLNNGLILLLCVFSSIGATWWISRRLSKPIQLLVQKSQDIQTGLYHNAAVDASLQHLATRNDEMGRFVSVYNHMVADTRQRAEVLERLVLERTLALSQSNQLLADKQERLQQELQLAHDMQQALLPQHFPDNKQFSVHAAMHPAQEMGGDFYDCFELDNGHLAILVADVAGKGIASAFFMAISSTLIKQAAAKHPEPHLVLGLANEWLCQNNPLNLFVTVFYAVFDPSNLTLNYANAGHHSALLRPASGTITPLSSPAQLPLGAWEGVSYTSHTVSLPFGSCLLLYSDGVTEALSPDGQDYGEARLQAALCAAGKHRHAHTIFQTLQQDVARFVAHAQAHDDMTALVLKVPAHPANNTPSQDWQLPPSLIELDRTNAAISEYLNALLPEQTAAIGDVSVCLEELLSNTIQYGKLPADATLHISIGVSHECITCCLQDTAAPFNPFTVTPPKHLEDSILDKPMGGLGLHLVSQLVDECDYHSHAGRNTTFFVKLLHHSL